MIRVLVVDDSATARALLVAILGHDPGIEIVGEAKDGLEGVELAKRLKPDVVTMDVRMPRMDGFEATKEIMIETPRPIVVVTASLEVTEVAVSMQALRAGAVCVLRKPPGPQAPGYAVEARRLVETVKAMADVKVVGHSRAAARRMRQPVPAAAPGQRIVAIAASTGGPAALHRLLSELPADFAAPILVVQHISRGFVPGLASWLNGACGLRVKVAEAGTIPVAGTVYVAPDDRHLGLAQGAIALSSAAPIGGFRPSASFLFESVARAIGAATVALVLTGMGNDGVAGLTAVRQSGGRVVAQDEATSVVFGMPKAAIDAGLVDDVLPLEAMPAQLAGLVAGSLGRPSASAYPRRAGGAS
jgi:two-component system chemotaxis response regulator CheB